MTDKEKLFNLMDELHDFRESAILIGDTELIQQYNHDILFLYRVLRVLGICQEYKLERLNIK